VEFKNIMAKENVEKKVDTRVRDSKFVRNPGKTAKDRANSAQARNAANKAARASWQQDSRATNASFPK
jgi:hypothetical protein